jgi:hypothetical protein
MPQRSTVEDFVATVEAGDFVGAIERFYAPEASMQENNETPRVGRDVLVAHEKQVLKAFPTVTARHLDTIKVEGDEVAIHWRFEMTAAGGGTRVLEEIAWQRWQGERIVAEQFFYDPKQMAS